MKRRKGKRVAEKVDGEPDSQLLGVSFDDLPSHITANILLRLPVKPVLICKCFCTSWKALISDPHFTKLHFQHAPTGLMIRARDPGVSRILHLLENESEKFKNDDDGQFCCCEDSHIKPECNCHFKLEHKLKLPLRGAKLDLEKRDETEKRGGQRSYLSSEPEDEKFVVVNSCNGLLCLSDLDKNYFVVCNPVTGEFIKLPEGTKVDRSEYKLVRIFVGFGFQPKTNEYKLVRIFKGCSRVQEPRVMMGVEIHTLGTSTWRNVEVDPRHVSGLEFPTCVSGALYWIGYYQRWLSVVCFDFESESFQSFPPPRHLFVKGNITMGEYGGSLYICTSSSGGTIKMWILKKYGLGESWTNVFSVDITSQTSVGLPYVGLYWPVKHLKNGAGILMYHACNCIIYYEPEKCVFKIFKVRGTQSIFEAIPHIPSLISLKDAVKGDNIKVMNVHSRCAKLKLQEENEVLFLARVNALNAVTNLCGARYSLMMNRLKSTPPNK